jgi:hypothetical protein
MTLRLIFSQSVKLYFLHPQNPKLYTFIQFPNEEFLYRNYEKNNNIFFIMKDDSVSNILIKCIILENEKLHVDIIMSVFENNKQNLYYNEYICDYDCILKKFVNLH